MLNGRLKCLTAPFPCPRSSDPIQIAEPVSLRGMTLEERLLTFDWKSDYSAFERAYTAGPVKATCQIDHEDIAPGSASLISICWVGV